MILQSKYFYDGFRKNKALFNIFPVISTSKPMKMTKTEFRGIFLRFYTKPFSREMQHYSCC